MKPPIEHADLAGTVFLDVNLAQARFEDVRLAGAVFCDVNLSGVSFEDVSLANAILRNANCSHLTIDDACYEGMRIDGILVTELLRVYRSQPSGEPIPS